MNVSAAIRALSTAAVLLVIPCTARSQVNWKNGNYSVSYTDLRLEGLEIQRAYNSKATTTSIFGYGWGWIGGSRLLPLADGGVTVIYWGGGLTSFFPAPFPSEAAIGNAVREIVAGRVAMGWKADPDEAAAFRAELRENLEIRSYWSRLLSDSSKLRAARHPMGTRWMSSGDGEKLLRVGDGYILNRTDSDTLEFDEEGRLTRTGGNSETLVMSYDQRGRIASVRSKVTGATAVFSVSDQGFLTSVVATNQSGTVKTASYKHDARGDIIESTDADGNRYRYTFDDLHNLTRIDYEDGTFRSITYDPVSNYATRVINRDGTWTEYEYYGDDDLYGTRVTERDSISVTKRSRAEWEIRTTEDGRRFTWRHLLEEGDTLTERFYSECCENPVRIRKKTPTSETTTNYDGRGNIVRP